MVGEPYIDIISQHGFYAVCLCLQAPETDISWGWRLKLFVLFRG